jgi:hypothetical protein
MNWVRICSGAAGISLACIVAAIALTITNKSLRQQASERQQSINQGLTSSQVYSRLVNSIATAAVKNNDDQLKQLLTDHGIILRSEAQQAPPAK